ncbi:GntR family transcriptional regulator [Herbiconiux sp. VKM Ac-2851]|uniref:GntR family transcriptional regulator n=1 Tax=Herbiconiux sp. VKM Ac-2851 TaxID=2739025 RepID=UPI0015666A36|nr:GntR family transcriptional regulator [Herbiconiux sp. VKM Ac-2851]
MARASELAYEALRSEILSWQLAPGAVLAEVELSGRLGISRTPVREALARLVADGLVEPQGGRGLIVTAVSAANVTELFELRRALETEAAALAARRRSAPAFVALQNELREVPALLTDPDPGRHAYYDLATRFDAAIDEAVRNPFLVQALTGVRTHLARLRRLSRDNPARLLEAAREHLLIVDAIVDGDPQLAADATRVHLARSLRATLGSLDADPPATPARASAPTDARPAAPTAAAPTATAAAPTAAAPTNDQRTSTPAPTTPPKGAPAR